MRKIHTVVMILLWISLSGFAQGGNDNKQYHAPSEILQKITDLQKANKNVSKLHLLGYSSSGQAVQLIEIGQETASDKKTLPAIFVAANFEGTNPLASEASIFLIRDLLKKPEKFQNLTWYILPTGNPEGAEHFFSTPKMVDSRNFRPFNDDMDDQTDEDPCEDLNGDGYISQMRVKDPAGTMVIDSTDERRMRAAKSSKGEIGIYKIYTEGIDNDGDGKYNEDGKGGTNNGISFPHLFKYHGSESGLWPGQEGEVFGVLKFMTDHPEIALVMTYGSSNFCMMPPKSGRKGETSMKSLKIPKSFASMLNADPNKRYSMEEVKDMVKLVVPPGMEVDDAMIADMLGLGAAVNPLPKDLKIYTSYSGKYKKFLKEKGYSTDRLDPKPAKNGSFELWAYYQLGLPSFSQDFWGVPIFKPEKPDSAATAGKKMPSKPSKPSMASMMKGKKSSKKPDAEKTFLAYNDSILNGKGFVNWTSYNHPQLGEVEIGGRVPYADIVPQANEIEAALQAQVPWIYELSKGIPELVLEAQKIKAIGDGIYQIEVWISNKGKFHFPLAIGSRNNVPAPAIVTLSAKDIDFLRGRERTPLGSIEAGQKQKLSWLIRTTKSDEVKLTIQAVNARGSETNIKLGGTK